MGSGSGVWIVGSVLERWVDVRKGFVGFTSSALFTTSDFNCSFLSGQVGMPSAFVWGASLDQAEQGGLVEKSWGVISVQSVGLVPCVL